MIRNELLRDSQNHVGHVFSLFLLIESHIFLDLDMYHSHNHLREEQIIDIKKNFSYLNSSKPLIKCLVDGMKVI